MAKSIRWWESPRNLGFLGTVVAGIVVAALLWMFGRVPIARWAAAVWGVVVYPVRVPAVLLVAMIALLLVVGVRAFLKAATPKPPAWLSYRQDSFLGIDWRWNYDGLHIARRTIRPYCPRCHTGLRGEQHGYGQLTTQFICDECRFVQEVPGSGDDVLDRICRLIEREATRTLPPSG